jgi:protocatechuate 3,4-dioxygenase beta subunit
MHALLLALSLLAADEKTTVTLKGTVKDAAGKPVAGALVVANPYRTEEIDPSRLTKTNDRGEFTLADVGAENNTVRVLAYRSGYTIGDVSLGSADSLASPIDFSLALAKPLTLTVLGPNNSPVPGAEISNPIYEPGGKWQLVPAWKDELARKTNASGQATFDYLSTASSLIFAIKTAEYGEQNFQVATDPRDQTIHLRPVGRLEGRVIAPDGKAAANLPIDVNTSFGARNDGSGHAALKTDADGRFVIDRLAEGEGRITIHTDRSRPFRQPTETNVKVVAGKTATVEIPLVKAARVTGKVVEIETQKPVAGVKLFLSNRVESEQVVSDADGTFVVYFGPGSIYGNINETPKGYFNASFLLNIGGEIKPDTKELALKTIELARSIEREVIVVDEQGKPAADAWVDATWVVRHDQYTTLATRSAKTDEAGKCTLELLPDVAEIYLRASTKVRAGNLVASTVGKAAEIRLTVDAKNSAILTGRVVDQAGTPIAKASVRIQSGEYRQFPRGYQGDMGTTWTVTTDEQGRFRSPHPLPRNLELPKSLTSFRPDSGYLIAVEAPGKLLSQTRFPLRDGDSPVEMPDIVLQEARQIAGRVVDADGKPVEGAEVQAAGRDDFRTASVRTAKDGRFKLAGIHPQARFFFARHADYRFTGLPIASGELTVTLERRDAAATPLAVAKLPADEVADRLRKVLVPVYEKHGAKLHPAQRSRILELLAKHDPEFVLAELPKVEDAHYRCELLLKLGQLEDAEAAAAANKTPFWRAHLLLQVSRAHANAGRRRELLAEALVQAKGVIEPDRRLGLVCNVAEELFDLGDKDAAGKLVKDNLKEIESLEAGFYRGYLAETVALFDVDKALKLCDGATDEFERDRHPGNIAHELAAIDPARAETILKSISSQGLYRYAPRVAYRMAAEDLPRARRIVDLVPADYPSQRQHALGLVALAIHGKDPDEARNLLKQAFDELDGDKSARQDRRTLIPSSMALVHLSETIDPSATREYLWRTIALIPIAAESPDSWSRQQARQQEAKLAILLMRYGLYPEAAAQLAGSQFTQEDIKSHDPNTTAAYYAMALADADRSTKWLEDYIKRTKGDELKYIPQPWELMGEALASDDKEFWDSLDERVLHLWVVDKEDF